MSVKTQGTKLYFINVLTSSTDDFVKMDCPTGITGLGGAADQIETTCLEVESDKTYIRGLGSPGQVSVPFILKPASASQQDLFDLKELGVALPWLICLSDGSAEPTVTSGAFVPPANRTSISFSAYISDINVDIATNEVVRGTLTLQRSGSITPTWKA